MDTDLIVLGKWCTLGSYLGLLVFILGLDADFASLIIFHSFPHFLHLNFRIAY